MAKLLIVSSGFRNRHFKEAPNSPLARVPQFDSRGIERPTGRVTTGTTPLARTSVSTGWPPYPLRAPSYCLRFST